MKFIIEHDERGTIKTIGAAPKEGKQEVTMALKPRPGCKVVTVEIPEIRDANDHERILAIKRKHRVEEHQGTHRLTLLT